MGGFEGTEFEKPGTRRAPSGRVRGDRELYAGRPLGDADAGASCDTWGGF